MNYVTPGKKEPHSRRGDSIAAKEVILVLATSPFLLYSDNKDFFQRTDSLYGTK